MLERKTRVKMNSGRKEERRGRKNDQKIKPKKERQKEYNKTSEGKKWESELRKK